MGRQHTAFGKMGIEIPWKGWLGRVLKPLGIRVTGMSRCDTSLDEISIGNLGGSLVG